MPALNTAALEQAYTEQHAFCRLRQWRGDAVVGYKVDCATPITQRQLNIEQPMFGRLFHSGRWPSGTTMPLTRFSSLAIEGELAVRLGQDLPVGDISDARLHSAVDSVFAVIELRDPTFIDEQTASSLVASNAIHAGFVYATDAGSPLDAEPATLRVEVDDVEVAQVAGETLTDTVTESLRWLAKELHGHRLRLYAGQTVLCGATMPLIPIGSACRVSVVTDRFGSVACKIEESGELTTPLR